jgi:hypothetical protein
MKRNTAFHRTACLIGAGILTNTTPLAAQVPAYLSDLEQANMAYAYTTFSLVNGVLLGLGVAVTLLVIVCIGHLCRTLIQTSTPKTRNRRRFTALGLVLLGLSMAGSSCTVTQRAAIFSQGPSQPTGDRWCPQHYHQADAEFPDLTRTVGYPVPRQTFCRYCGQRIVRRQP